MKKKFYAMLLTFAIITALFTTIASAATATYGGRWSKTSLTYYVPSSISTTYGSSIRSAIINGITSWSGVSSVTLKESTSPSHDIGAFMDYYGNTGWDGHTTHNPDTYSYYTYVKIQLNTYTYYNYTGSSYANLWRALACHETGHALGLGHASAADTSVMCNGTVNYYNINGSKKIYTPQQQDKNALKTIY